MDDYNELEEEMPLENVVVANVEACNLECQHLQTHRIPLGQCVQWGVDDCPGITQWKVSCTEVRSARLRPILMNVFLMMRLSEAPLSIRVLATLCHLIGSLTMKGKFRLDSFVSRT
jgi:hypothetical protein